MANDDEPKAAATAAADEVRPVNLRELQDLLIEATTHEERTSRRQTLLMYGMAGVLVLGGVFGVVIWATATRNFLATDIFEARIKPIEQAQERSLKLLDEIRTRVDVFSGIAARLDRVERASDMNRAELDRMNDALSDLRARVASLEK